GGFTNMEFIRSPSLWSKFLKRNGYTIHECIGAGSFGDVFAVTKEVTGVRLAMKRLVSRGSISDDTYAMTEINALLTFDHLNIIGLEEFFMWNSLACVVLELAPCGNLEVMILERDRKVKDIFIQISFRQLLSAVNYCHGLGYAHRDINPSNILIFNDNLVKLADFGLCVQCIDENTRESIMCSDYLGHEAFLAPEVKLQKPFNPISSDVWSLGCVLFFMLNRGNPPTNVSDPSKMTDIIEKVMDQNAFKSVCLIMLKNSLCTRALKRPHVSQLISFWTY
ncbi:unnamed protein product, partial [Candidula unifasciata]